MFHQLEMLVEPGALRGLELLVLAWHCRALDPVPGRGLVWAETSPGTCVCPVVVTPGFTSEETTCSACAPRWVLLSGGPLANSRELKITCLAFLQSWLEARIPHACLVHSCTPLS